MKGIIACLPLILLSIFSYAQVDTTKNKNNATTEYYDVVAVYHENTDGRGRPVRFTTELKGEIVNYDASTGVITFKTSDGKMYSLKNGEYKYFQYNKAFTQKNKESKKLVLRERKETQFQLTAGWRLTALNLYDNFKADDYYVWSQESNSDVPIALYFGGGKYFGRRHYAGLGGELALSSYGKNYINAGLRYVYQYDGYKRNTAFYLPLELNYFTAKYNQNYDVADTLIRYFPGGGYSIEYPSQKNIDQIMSAVSFSFGQGMSFMLNDKHSISLELSVIKLFPLSTTFPNPPERLPNVKMEGMGLRFGLLYNL
jgi:hypothetical protein